MALKQIEIRLTDIWHEREKQLHSLRKQTANLNRCQKASEMINKHLVRCNETLLTIVDKCRIDLVDNKQIIELITFIRDDENSIAMWKNRLNSYKRELDYDNECANSLTNSCQNCLKKFESFDKCVQTEPNNVSVINLNEFNDNSNNDANIEDINSDTKVEYNGVHIYNVECHLIGNDFKDQTEEQTAVIIPVDDYREDKKNSVVVTDVNSLRAINLDNQTEVHSCIDLPSDNESDFCLSDDNLMINLSDSSDTDWEKDKKRSKKRKLIHKLSKSKSKANAKTPKDPITPKTPKVPKTVTETENPEKIQEKTETQKRKIYVEQLLAEYKVNRKYVCNKPACDFLTGKSNLFIRHLNRDHNGDGLVLRPYVCDWPGCNQAYKALNHLKNHKNFWHKNLRPFECDWPGCGFKLRREIDLNIHRRIHTKEKPLACEWPGCAYQCNAKWSLIAHKRKHTGEKPYECLWPDCNYRCSQPGTLILHKRKHTGEKPYKCEHFGCDKTFSVLSGLHLHRNVHAKHLRKKD